MITLFAWLIPWTIYGIGYVFAFRRIAGQMAWHCFLTDKKKHPSSYKEITSPNGEQWFGSIVFGLVVSIVWMISLPIACGIAGSKKNGRFFYIPSEQKEKMYKERIQELERAAGI